MTTEPTAKHQQEAREGGGARIERLEAQLNGVMNSLAVSQQEVERLRAGRFTPKEFQNLCHGFDESDKEAFIAGCLEYQKKLFGCTALSSRDREIREVLEGLRTGECWCPDGQLMEHSPACLATQVLWNKVQG